MQEPSQKSINREEHKMQITCKSTHIQSDDEVDRFILYISRNLVLALHNGQHQINQIGLKTASDCPSYRIDVKSIECIDGHAGIAEKCLELKERLALELVSTISSISKISLSVFRDSLESVLQKNYELDDKKVDRSYYVYPLEKNVRARLQKSKEVYYHSDSIQQLVLEIIGGIAEYSSDIAEIAISERIGEIRESKKGEGDQTHE